MTTTIKETFLDLITLSTNSLHFNNNNENNNNIENNKNKNLQSLSSIFKVLI